MRKAHTKGNSRSHRKQLKYCDEVASGSATDIDRLYAWAARTINPDRFSKTLLRLPEAMRVFVEIGYRLVVLGIILVPVFILTILLGAEFAMHFLRGYMLSADRPGNAQPSELIKHAKAGAASSVGGKKGGASKKKSNYFGERDKEIQDYARTCLAAGQEFRNLPSLLAEHFGSDAGFPKTARRYRSIIKQLK